MEPVAIISVMLAGAILIALIGGLWTRINQKKGIGWQFIRYTTIVVALPLAALLQLNGGLSEAMAAIIAGALGYAFGKTEVEASA